MRALTLLFRRELALAWSGGGGPLLALGFYASITTLIPLAVAPSPGRLAAVATGVAWVALARASLLSLERMFERDFEDGALELLALGPLPLEAVAAVKCLAHWTRHAGAPLALAAPVAAAALGAPLELAPLIAATAAIGGLAFAFVGGVGAALAIGSKRGGLIIAVVVLPLLSPPVLSRRRCADRLRRGPAVADGPAAAQRLRPCRHGALAVRSRRGVPQRHVIRMLQQGQA